MADVTFEGVSRRPGLRILPIAVLAALLLVGLVYFFVAREDPRRLAVPSAEENAVTQGAYAGTLTELAPLIAVGDKGGLAGREVALEGVQVVQVLGPRSFLVGPGMSQKALVVWQREAHATSGAAPKIDAGDTVAVHGVVRPLPDSPQGLNDWGAEQLTPAERAALQVAVVAKAVVETVDRGGTE